MTLVCSHWHAPVLPRPCGRMKVRGGLQELLLIPSSHGPNIMTEGDWELWQCCSDTMSPEGFEHVQKHVCTGEITDWRSFPCLRSEICHLKQEEDDWALNVSLLCWGKQLVCRVYLGQTVFWALLRCFTPCFPDHYWKVNGRADSGLEEPSNLSLWLNEEMFAL